jgi:hypothetical protein
MPFRIETEWIDAAGIRGRELAATWASLLIGVDGEIVTRVVDERARTVRNDIYVPLYVLAEWLVTNWWFLFHEVENPSKEDDPAFGRRHALGASREEVRVPQSSGGAGRHPHTSRLDTRSDRQRSNRVPVRRTGVDRE